MKKILLWATGIIGLLLFFGVCLVFFYPDQKLKSFDDLSVSLLKFEKNKNGYDEFLAAVKLLNFNDDNGEYAVVEDFITKLDSLQFGDWNKVYFFLKQNNKFFTAFDELNKFDYFFSDRYSNYKNYPIHKRIPELNSEPRINRLLIARILYKLQQNQMESSLKGSLNLINFNHKMVGSSDSLMLYVVRAGKLEQSLRVLRMILETDGLTKDQYLEVLNSLGLFKNDLGQIRLNVLKLEFFPIIDYVDNLHLYTEDYSGGRSWLDLSYSKYHFQPNLTKNLTGDIFRRSIENSFIDSGDELLALNHVYNSKFDLLIGRNSIGYALLNSFVFSLNTGCRDLTINFDLATIKLSAAIKLFQLENNKIPENLEELVPKYFKDLDWMKYAGENFFSYDSKKKLLYSELLDKKCNKAKESVYYLK